MTCYVVSADAELDLGHIWDFIAEDSIDMADRWIGKLFDAFERLARTPGLGRKRDEITVAAER